MLPTRWADWSARPRRRTELAGPLRRVVVAGLSMGGTLTLWLAAAHPEIAGIVCINPAVEPPPEGMLELRAGAARRGRGAMAGIGSDIADPDAGGAGLRADAAAPAALAVRGRHALRAPRRDIRCPVLV